MISMIKVIQNKTD